MISVRTLRVTIPELNGGCKYNSPVLAQFALRQKDIMLFIFSNLL